MTLGSQKTCKGCGQEFELRHLLQEYCSKLCKSRYLHRLHAPRHREKHRANNAAYYQKNRDHILQQAKDRWRGGGKKEKQAKKYREYMASLSPEQRRERRAQWDANYERRRSELYHETRQRFPWRNALNGSKVRAKKLSAAFDLDREWCEKRWTGRCEVTNIEFILSKERNPYIFSPSLDRIVPSLGYTKDNCRFVLHAVNALKGAGSDEDMYRIALAITSHKSSKS